MRSAAQVRYQRGDFEAAAESAGALVESQPPPEELPPALLLLGAASLQEGESGQARDALQRYVDESGAAAPQARLMLASALSSDGDDERAVEELEAALTEGLPPPQATEAMSALARGLDTLDREAEALDVWETLGEDAATPFERGEALWNAASLARRLGENERYQDALVTLGRDYPWHQRALESLGLAVTALPDLTAVEKGVILFNHGEDAAARQTFEEAIAEGLGALDRGRAHLYLAFLDERADENERALESYDAALAALEGLESERLYGETAWERALLLEALGRTEEAVAGYAGLAEASPESGRAPEAVFRAGLLRFRGGLPGEAAAHWARYLELAPNSERARARLWLAKASLALGDGATADAHLAEAAAAAPWDYFGLRAAALLEGAEALSLSEPAPDPPQPDWAAVEAWLLSFAGPEDPASPDIREDTGWRRGAELLGAGLVDDAEDQFGELLNDAAGDPWRMYRLARALAAEGRTATAARAAARLVGDRADAPRDILRVAYPADYLDLAEAEAEANGFPPLLLLALVRQESFFEPDAVSSAGALGLTQVIPTTADEIAEDLGESGFTYGDLLRPNVSLRFGSHYLGSQLDLFEGEVPPALAAYNGGPGNSLRWREAAPDDPDVFLESITLSETRAYVELVLEHYARYRYAYGLAEGPTLPLA